MKESERDADFVAESASEADEDDESGEDKGEVDSDLEQSCGSEEGDSFDVDPKTNLSQQARNAHSSQISTSQHHSKPSNSLSLVLILGCRNRRSSPQK
jgi:hypothetical protein